MQVFNDFLLSEVLWYNIGGCANYLLECRTKEDILEAFEFIKKNNIKKYLVVGLGANLLVSDKEFDGAVIKLYRDPDLRKIHESGDGLVSAFAGELLDDLIHYSFEHNLKGFEWAGGLPSTVGGAIRGNVGAFGSEIKDTFHSAEVLNAQTGSVEILNYDQMNFAYRTTIVKQQKNLIVLSATFQFTKLTQSELEEAKKVYHQNCDYRAVNHPIEYPSCGSTFKNIHEKDKVEKVLSVFPDLRENVETRWHGKVATGSLIALLGLRGFTVGNAQVSEKHSNFIINLGGATFQDVYTIIQTVKEKFAEKFGFPPEAEIEIIQ